MFYCEVGDFKILYEVDNQIFLIVFDCYWYWFVLFVVFLVILFVIFDYLVNVILILFLIYGIVVIGLNILMGYCGQVSFGIGGFMVVGVYVCYKLMMVFFDVNILIYFVLVGGIIVLVGVVFGLLSLWIKGFYLVVVMFVVQFFLIWLFNKVVWFYNYFVLGQINVFEWIVIGVVIIGFNLFVWVIYFVCLIFLMLSVFIVWNLICGLIGCKWMVICDMDIVVEIIGVNLLIVKLMVFVVLLFFVGLFGVLFFVVYFGVVEVGEVFGINKLFFVLFMIIIGGLGLIFGLLVGVVFFVCLFVIFKLVGVDLLGWFIDFVVYL